MNTGCGTGVLDILAPSSVDFNKGVAHKERICMRPAQAQPHIDRHIEKLTRHSIGRRRLVI